MKEFVTKYYKTFILFYTFWMFYLLFFLSVRDVPLSPFEIKYMPFHTINVYTIEVIKYDVIEFVKNIFGNIILFIPYGFLGIVFPKLRNAFVLMLTFFISINIIEFSQYFFNRGFADVDDVILNSFGVYIGFLLYKNVFKITKA